MTNADSAPLLTVGDIARALAVPAHRVKYALDLEPPIRAVMRAGIIRLYEAGTLELVRRRLEQSPQHWRMVRRQPPNGGTSG